MAYERIGEYDKSIDDLTKAIEIEPAFYSFFSRGKANRGKKDYRAALSDFLAAVELLPSDYRSLNAAARLLASSPIESDRNGAHALELAKLACEATSYEDCICLATLACAYAESGDFVNAAKWGLKARDLFVEEFEVKDGSDVLEVTLDLLEYQGMLNLFESGKPFRET